MATFRDSFAIQLRQLEKLPTLPQMLWELEAAFQNPVMGVMEIADLIQKDLSLTATLLKISNSVFFRGSSDFSTVRDAVVRIGLQETRRVARSMLLVDALSAPASGTMDYNEFWRHSLLVAVAAEFLQEHGFEESPLLPEEAYLAGLLHDVGKLVLDQYFEPEYRLAAQYEAEHGCPRAEAERESIQVDHGEIGAELLELWGLPANISEPVRWHHALESAPEEWKLPALVIATADQICHEREKGENASWIEGIPRAAELAATLEREERIVRIITNA